MSRVNEQPAVIQKTLLKAQMIEEDYTDEYNSCRLIFKTRKLEGSLQAANLALYFTAWR
ncbi:hypothetical protein N9235_02195 [Gammaproteobacteria bacterium]|nr:hypothetical protein [Gammaproteobacteria bacterium]